MVNTVIIYILTAIVIISILAWVLILKGVALWNAARKGNKKWFIALLVINTFGILDALYIFYFSKRSSKISPTKDGVVVEIETK
ncbi:hypothetical protein COW81_02870 [Candidatus Campbellbacteria bacterium CG22_combo_CG10-13_8_21_14_all_36_13]|uniref:DUF5652 domain-containing protein n=1 Tax=Candidatus Campbellbacteria bacterium CG22_combo_CG10-13_8_21_14_all_36_13 TaxID=1974529 RepID=A0A2H0DZ25_9BACT|nr:MAG: hypothetical protein COW81_02870 [Candidatus Campbellbacteria bacterium CG22_combo_CG10-13_8_21_14_all_36_13]